MAGLEEELSLDYAGALDGVDAFADRADGRIAGVGDALNDAISAALRNSQGAVDTFADSLEAKVTAAIESAGERLRSTLADAGAIDLGGTISPTVAPSADTTAIDEAAAAIATQVESPTLKVEADISDAERSIESLDDTEIKPAVEVDTSRAQDAIDSIAGSTVEVQVDAAAADVTAQAPPPVPIEADTTDAENKIEALGDIEVTTPVDADTSGALDSIESISGDAAPVEVGVEADTSDAEKEVASISDLAPTVVVTADTDEAQASTAGLKLSLDEIDTSTYAVEVDHSSIDAARTEVDDLSASLDDFEARSAQATSGAGDGASGAASVATDGADALSEALGGVQSNLDGVSVFADAATGHLQGVAGTYATVAGGISSFAPKFGATLAAGVGLAAATELIYDKAVKADSISRRWNATMGPLAARMLDLDEAISGVDGGLEGLNAATGSSTSKMKGQLATLTELGRSAGLTDDQIVSLGQNQALLANYIAATRPELGSADEIMARFGRTLTNGGFRAQQLGIDIRNAAEVTAKASEMFGKPASELSVVEKQAAGAALAIERIPNIGEKIAAGADAPIVKLRALETRLSSVLTAAGQPLVEPLTNALDELGPVAENAANILGDGLGVVVPAVTNLLKIIAPVLSGVTSLISSIPTPVVTAGAAAYAFSKGLDLLHAAAIRVAGPLAKVGDLIGDTKGADTLRLFAAGSSAADRANLQLATSTETAAASQAALARGLDLATESSLSAGLAGLALADVERSATVAAEAHLLTVEKQAELDRLIATQRAGGAVNVGAMALAEEEVAVAKAAESIATEKLAADQLILNGFVQQAILEGGPHAAMIQALATAYTEEAAAARAAQLAQEGTSTGAGVLGLAVGGVTAALAIGVGAWMFWKQAQEEANAETKEALKLLKDLSDSSPTSDRELATRGSGTDADKLAEANKQAEKFSATVKDEDLSEDMDRLGYSTTQVGKAIAGDHDALIAFLRFVKENGELQIGDTLRDQLGIGGISEQASKVFEEEWVKANGEVGKAVEATNKRLNDLAKNGDGEGGNLYIAKQGALIDVFEAQAAAANRARTQLRRDASQELADYAKAETKDEKAAVAERSTAVRELYLEGQAGLLSEAERRQAQSLLRQSAAAKDAAAAQAAIDAQVADATATSGQGSSAERQAKALQTLNAEIAKSGTLTRGKDEGGDLGELRALKASAAYDKLQPEVKQTIDSILDLADASLTEARANGKLVSSLGELSSSFADIDADIDKSIGRYRALATAQSTTARAERSWRATLDDVTSTLKEHGTVLDDQAAKWDASKVTGDNYQQFLQYLDPVTRKNIESMLDLATAADKANDSLNPGDLGFEQGTKAQVDAAIRRLDDARARVSAAAAKAGLTTQEATEKPNGEVAAALDEQRDAERNLADAATASANAQSTANTKVTQTAQEKRDATEKANEAAAAAVRDALGGSPATAENGPLTIAARNDARDAQAALDKGADAIQATIERMMEAHADPSVIVATAVKMAGELAQTAAAAGVKQSVIDAVLKENELTPEDIQSNVIASQYADAIVKAQKLEAVLEAAGVSKERIEKIKLIDDPKEQLAALEGLIATLTEPQQIAVKFSLDEVSVEEAKKKYAEILDPKAAAVSAGKLDQASADKALQSIEDWKKKHPDAGEFPVTVGTLTGVDAINADFEAKKHALVVDPTLNPTEVQEGLATLTKQRDMEITALLKAASADGGSKTVLDKLEEFQTNGANIPITLTPQGAFAQWLLDNFGTETPATPAGPPARKGAPRVPGPSQGNHGRSQSDQDAETSNVSLGLPAGSKPLPSAGIDPISGNPRVAVTPKGYEYVWTGSRWTLIPGVKAHAKGGTTLDPDVEERLRQRMSTGAPLDEATSGFHGAGAYVAAEASTAGEYIISRDITARTANQGYVKQAAADLGVPLAATVAPTEISVKADGGGGDQWGPEINDGIRELIAATTAEQASRLERPPIDASGWTIEAPTPDQAADRTFDALRSLAYSLDI